MLSLLTHARFLLLFIPSSMVGGDERACTRWCQGAQTVRTGGKTEERERENRMKPLPKPEQQ